jgi:carboxymethylenebutenolidase
MSDIQIDAAGGGRFTGYLAVPKGGKGPGIVVAQEIFGVNAVMREVCDNLAAQGYAALCPDIFWRLEPGIQISDKTDAEWKRAFDLFNRFDVDRGIEDLKAALSQLRHHPACTGKVGSVGYCLGGKLAYLMATRSDVDCSVGYYGVGIQDLLGEAGNVRNPLALHLAEKDQYTPPAARESIVRALKDNPRVTLYSYPGMDHAFARTGGAHYDAAAASLANDRTSKFLRTHLGG